MVGPDWISPGFSDEAEAVLDFPIGIAFPNIIYVAAVLLLLYYLARKKRILCPRDRPFYLAVAIHFHQVTLFS